jgi:hypothetical protein
MNATAKIAKTATAPHACACSGFKAVDASGTKVTTTDCNATTRRIFAPGHDARMKGFLIRAGREGLLVRTPEGGADQVPAKVAERFGFAHMVRDGIARKTAKKVAKKTAPKVTAKVGRWFYEGFVTEGGALFSYTDAKGASKTATKFTLA